MNLGNFLVDVMNKKKTASQYQLPTVKPKVNKVIMNEEERISWMNEYCNSDNDYDSLALEVPAGLRIDHIIDRLSETNQSLSRCVWIIKLFILSEKSVKEKSTLILSHEWTNLFIKILEKQILLIIKNTETENEGVEKKFVSKWNYCIQVSKLLYDQDILDQKLFLRWLVESINNSIVKCALLLPLILSLLSEFSRSRALCIMKIRSLTSYHERLINNNDQNMFQTVFKAYCRTIIQITMLNFPDIFINSEISSSDKIDWNRIVNLPAHPLQDVIYKSLGFQLDSNKLKAVYQSILKRNKNFEQKEIKKEITQQLTSKQDKEDFLKDFIPLKLGLNISNITIKAFINIFLKMDKLSI
ncbi:hypothetical protein K502DRAFT_62271 [Neoconidiobolus thromboides FSU 785]|nr:hypothetical protein K502DRAFT_62271 [Neoconidiobolus thromboides FSU 785]